MAFITQQMLRTRLTEQLAMPPLAAEPPADYDRVALLSISANEVFLAEAHRRILEREPEAHKLRHFLAILETHPREAVLGDLLRERRMEQSRAYIDLTYLDDVQATDELVMESYRSILGREAEWAGLAHYRALLGCGVSKAQVLAIIAASNEARGRNVEFYWHGMPLPDPSPIGFAIRLRLLVRKLRSGLRMGDSASTESNPGPVLVESQAASASGNVRWESAPPR